MNLTLADENAKAKMELEEKIEKCGVKSNSPFAKLQLVQAVDENNEPITGQVTDTLMVFGVPTLVICNFKDGYFHSDGDRPAIEYPMHWEYWENGYIKKIKADGGDTEEYWENGLPVRIETNLAERREKGEDI